MTEEELDDLLNAPDFDKKFLFDEQIIEKLNSNSYLESKLADFFTYSRN
jgi:hypothetical protein